MCRAPKVKQPKIVVQGPSKKDVKAERQAMEQFMQQSQQQQAAFASALQAQIDAANRQSQEFSKTLAQERSAFNSGMPTEADAAAQAMAEQRQKAQLDMAAERAAAASQNAAITQSAYGVNTAEVAPVNPQVTQAPEPKKRDEQSSLRIDSGAIEALVGSGLNIGF